VIGKITAPRGERVAPLIYYLYGPGRREEHTDPHIVAGWRHPAELEPPLREDGTRDFRALLGLLTQPHAAMGTAGLTRPVWHCSVRAAPGDKMLSDDEWAQIASDVMHRTGLAPHGQEDDAVRWVAVRHGADHIHLVAMLARQDFRRPRLRNDRYRVREACIAAEKRYGLRSTAPADRTAPRCPSRGENEKATRRGLPEAPRVTLRRQVATTAAASASGQEFLARLDQAGVLVRQRYSARNPGQVTGYAVALPGDTGQDGGPVWYGGGKLAADLTWPALCQRWTGTARPPGPGPLTAAERNACWEHAARVTAGAAAQIRASPAAADDTARAASDALHAVAAALGSRILRQAADAYARAARAPYGRLPQPAPAGNRLRHAARLISAFACLTSDRTLTPVILLTRLAALAEAVAGLRESQHRAAQAAAARAAAEHLHAATRPAPAARPPAPPRARTTATLAAASFPGSPVPPRPRTPEPGQHAAAQAAPRPPRKTGPHRPRGPAR
jgi:hypothetical protein